MSHHPKHEEQRGQHSQCGQHGQYSQHGQDKAGHNHHFSTEIACRKGHQHDDHEYIAARMERDIQHYRDGRGEAIMKWMDEDDFEHSDFGMSPSGLRLKQMSDIAILTS